MRLGWLWRSLTSSISSSYEWERTKKNEKRRIISLYDRNALNKFRSKQHDVLRILKTTKLSALLTGAILPQPSECVRSQCKQVCVRLPLLVLRRVSTCTRMRNVPAENWWKVASESVWPEEESGYACSVFDVHASRHSMYPTNCMSTEETTKPQTRLWNYPCASFWADAIKRGHSHREYQAKLLLSFGHPNGHFSFPHNLMTRRQ